MVHSRLLEYVLQDLGNKYNYYDLWDIGTSYQTCRLPLQQDKSTIVKNHT